MKKTLMKQIILVVLSVMFIAACLSTRPVEKSNTQIRKQVYELTLWDLVNYPVWEFALDEEGKSGQDEATVRPHKTSGPVDDANGLFVVKASFVLADGTSCQGYVFASSERTIESVQPIIITPRGQVMFWHGCKTPNPDVIAKAYEKLGKSAIGLFPVHFQCEVPLKRGLISGDIPAFLSKPNMQVIETK